MASTFLLTKMPTAIGFLLSLLFIANEFPLTASRIDFQPGDRILSDRIVLEDEILDAKALLISLGVPERNLCRSKAYEDRSDGAQDNDSLSTLPLCDLSFLDTEIKGDISRFNEGEQARLLEEEEGEPTFEEDPLFYIIMGSCALLCVVCAALAAGLTMGLLSLDPLMLLVKIRASRSSEEKDQAESLLPIVKKHHLLLVSLLLLNSLANEALPLFLEKLVSPVVSVLLSVTFILIFGEILPSAIFTGPKKLELASRMVPVVKFFMFVLWPIAGPIAKILDVVLHEDDEDDGAFDRGEISALVRIQYEERLANKRQRKLEKMESSRLGSSANFPHPKPRAPDLEAAIKTAKVKSTRNLSEGSGLGEAHISFAKDVQSIHVDEVTMVEGALQMKTKTAMQVFTPIHRMFAVPDNLILNEENVVDIYSSGYSRIPVYEQNPQKPKSQSAIKGVLNTKNLIVVNMNEDRPLSTMPLLTPPCVSPKMNLVDLVNLFQTGRYGHFALVCARPHIGTEALKEGKAIPAAAALMGVVTLEDVLEELLQEEIFDEKDQMEREAERIALWVGRQWRRRSKPGLKSMASVVIEKVETTSESTSLLHSSDNPEQHLERQSSIFGSILEGLGLNKNS